MSIDSKKRNKNFFKKIVTGSLLLCFSTSLFIGDSALADEKKDIEDKISLFQENLKKTTGKIEASEHKISELEKEKTELNKKSKELNKDIDSVKKEIDVIQKDLDNKMVALQLTKDQNNLFSSIIKNKSLTSFINNRESLSQIQSQGNDLKELLKVKEDELSKKESLLKTNLESLNKNISEEKELSTLNDKEKLKIEKEMKDNKDILNELKKKEEAALSEKLRKENESAKESIQELSKNNNLSQSSINKLPPSNTGNEMVDEAYKYLGIPYHWGGTDPAIGLDCSGLTLLVANNVGKSLPRTSQDQQVAVNSIPLSDLQPGDLVFFGYPAYHVGIYIGGGNYIHAPEPGDVVKITNYDYFPYTSAGRI